MSDRLLIYRVIVQHDSQLKKRRHYRGEMNLMEIRKKKTAKSFSSNNFY